MNYQTLHVSHVSQQREYLQRIDELPGFFLTTLYLEGEDGACTIGEVFLIQSVVVVTLQSGVVYFCYLRVVGEEIDNLQGVLYVTLYAQTMP